MRNHLKQWMWILPLSFACGGEVPAETVRTSVARITNGTLDGDDHPYAGFLVFRDPSGPWQALCSGSLVEKDKFLTAAHCTELVASYGVAVGDYAVSFDAQFTQSSVVVLGASYQMHPGYRSGPQAINDVAVIQLQSPVVGVGLATLPPEGILDRMAAKGGLHGASSPTSDTASWASPSEATLSRGKPGPGGKPPPSIAL
jgi:V8-like Glu-specific endopeptidase